MTSSSPGNDKWYISYCFCSRLLAEIILTIALMFFSAGRSRKAGGTSVLLGSSKIRQKEMLNVARGIMMQKAIVSVKGMDRTRYEEKILHLQQDSLTKEDIKNEVRRHLTNRKTDTEFTLICGRCQEHCAASADLRTINQSHHVVIGDDFSDKMQIIHDKKQKKPIDGIRFTGKIRCKKCHSLWGVMFIYQNVSFPSLGIKYISVVDADGVPKMYKKWMNVPYTIQEIGLDDFKKILKNRQQAEEPIDAATGSQADDGSGSHGETGSGSQGETGSGSQGETGSGSQGETGSGSQGETGSGSQGETGSGYQGSTGSGLQEETSQSRFESDALSMDTEVTEVKEKNCTMNYKVMDRGEPDGDYI